MSNYEVGNGDYINIDGNLVERKASDIAQQLYEYDPDLSILCLDPNLAGLSEAPFIICGRKPDGSRYKIFEAWNLDQTVLERVYQADQHRFDITDRITSLEQAQKKLREDRYKEQHLQSNDLVATAVKRMNQKSSFTYRDDTGEMVTIYEDRPSRRGDGRTHTHS